MNLNNRRVSTEKTIACKFNSVEATEEVAIDRMPFGEGNHKLLETMKRNLVAKRCSNEKVF